MRIALVLFAATLCLSGLACGDSCNSMYDPSEATGFFHLPVSPSVLDGSTVTVCRGTACTVATMKADANGASGSQDPLTCSAISSDVGSELRIDYLGTPGDGEVFTVTVRVQNGIDPLVDVTASAHRTGATNKCGGTKATLS